MPFICFQSFISMKIRKYFCSNHIFCIFATCSTSQKSLSPPGKDNPWESYPANPDGPQSRLSGKAPSGLQAVHGFWNTAPESACWKVCLSRPGRPRSRYLSSSGCRGGHGHQPPAGNGVACSCRPFAHKSGSRCHGNRVPDGRVATAPPDNSGCISWQNNAARDTSQTLATSYIARPPLWRGESAHCGPSPHQSS